MRLLRVTQSMDPATGGVAEAIRLFGSVCQPLGCHLTVVCLDEPNAPWLQAAPFRVIGLGQRKGSYGYSPALAPWLKAHAEDFDTAIVDGLWQYHGWATRRALRGRVPYFVMPHGMLDPWFKRTYPLKHLKKWAYWPWAEYRILRDATGVIFTTEAERRKAAQSFWLYRTRQEHIASLGVAIPLFDKAKGRAALAGLLPALKERQPYLLFLSRLHEKKGVDLLIRAYRRLEATQPDQLPDLVLAGPAKDAAYLDVLKQLAEGSTRIHFSGMISGDVKWAALAGAQALVLPSHQENFGIVVAEALAVGTPVLLSEEVDIWREVCEAGAGWVCGDDEETVFAALQKFASCTATALADFRVRAHRCFQTHFESQRAAQDLLKVLKDNAAH